MTTYLPRTAWTDHGPVRALTKLVPSAVEGLAIHWPGTTGPIGDPGRSKVAARLEGYRRFHTGAPPVGRAWSDIAYNLAADQAGRVWDLRGVEYQSAANGDQAQNRRFVALLALVGPGEKPTRELVDAVRWARTEVLLKRYPGAKAVVGHRDVRPDPTDCPGDALEGLVQSGAFLAALLPPKHDAGSPYVLKRYLAEGATGKDVEALQKRLNALPGRDIRVDGDLGPDTEARVREVQRAHDLKADGVVGPVTATKVLGWRFELTVSR